MPGIDPNRTLERWRLGAEHSRRLTCPRCGAVNVTCLGPYIMDFCPYCKSHKKVMTYSCHDCGNYWKSKKHHKRK